MSLMNVYREQGGQPEKRIRKRLSERMGVEQKERDIRDSPIEGFLILKCGDRSKAKQTKNAFKASRLRRMYIRKKEESSNNANSSPSTTAVICPGFFHWLTPLRGKI